MIRTSLFLPEQLHQRLVFVARQEQMNLSELVRELLDRALAREEKTKPRQMYQVLKELDGKGEPEITDASTTIDAVLYGEAGAWKGSDEEFRGSR